MVLFRHRYVCPTGTKGFWVFFYLLLACACARQKQKAPLPFYNTADLTATWSIPGNAPAHTIDTFTLYNQLGHVFTADSLKNKIYVANFFFTSCLSICPKMTGNLATLQKRFSGDTLVHIVSFSVMPWADSVARLKQYGEAFKINPAQWHLLTGSTQRIYALARHSFFADGLAGLAKDTADFLHTGMMVLVDKNSRIRGVYTATSKAEVAQAADDLAQLAAE